MFEIDLGRFKRFFEFPCAVADNCLKLADEKALKLIIYLLASEEEPTPENIFNATGLDYDAAKEAAMFWENMGVIAKKSESADPYSVSGQDVLPSDPASKPAEVTVTKVVHTSYQPKDIAEMIRTSPETKELFSEAESCLGRLLKHADYETILSLRDYYGFDDKCIILILSHCASLEKTSPRYYETVGKQLYTSGISEFQEIEEEFAHQKERHSFEKEVCDDFGMTIKLTPKQQKYISSWKEMGFSIDMISLAREKCSDATNKISFPYIDKILTSWKEKNIFTPEAVSCEQKPVPKDEKEHSYDISEFDKFTLGEAG